MDFRLHHDKKETEILSVPEMASDNPAAPIVTQTKVTKPSGGSPWSKISAPAPCSLQDVMGEELSEELAKKLQVEEENELIKSADTGCETDLSPFLVEAPGDTADDFLIAQMLQDKFNQEYDDQLQREENKFNGTSKVKLSFDRYRQGHEDSAKRESAEEEEEEDDSVPKFKKGYMGKGKNIVTKHDEKFTYKKNYRKVMEFPPEFETGDIRGKEYRLPNHVYNQLKTHSNIDNKRKFRLHEKKEHSTAEMAVDEKTRLILYKLMNNQILEQINGVISTGKESVIMHADGGVMDTGFIPKECAIKVFKTTLSDFKNRSMYIQGDTRLHKDEFKKKNPRKIIKIWAEKEEFNLKRLRKCGIPCPTMVILKKHCLVMSFIGSEGRAAPKLKDAELGPAEIMDAYEQCLENVTKMYNSAGLVHGDLSEYNMLWHQGTLYFIDVSQSVDKFHPNAMQFLLRDCRNVSEFFTRAGVPEVPSQYELFNKITGFSFEGQGEEFLSQIEDYEKNEERLRLNKGKEYNFDFFFDQAQKEFQSQKRSAAENLDSDSEEDSDDDHGDDIDKKS